MANTAANRRLTFGTAGGRGAGRDQFRGLPVFLLALALTSGALAAAVLRFLLLRSFVFRSRRRPPA